MFVDASEREVPQPVFQARATKPGAAEGGRVKELRSPSDSHRWAVIWTCAITALGGLLFGYDTGVVSRALLFLQDTFGKLSAFDKELVTGVLLIGALEAGRIADRVGRRLTIIGTALVFVIGVVGAATAPAFPFLASMRFVIGLAVGSASMVVPLYISELAPPPYRGGDWSVSTSWRSRSAPLSCRSGSEQSGSTGCNWRRREETDRPANAVCRRGRRGYVR